MHTIANLIDDDTEPLVFTLTSITAKHSKAKRYDFFSRHNQPIKTIKFQPSRNGVISQNEKKYLTS